MESTTFLSSVAHRIVRVSHAMGRAGCTSGPTTKIDIEVQSATAKPSAHRIFAENRRARVCAAWRAMTTQRVDKNVILRSGKVRGSWPDRKAACWVLLLFTAYPLGQRSKCLTTMRDRKLLVFIDLGERRFIEWVIEDRVVAKSADARRGGCNSTFDGAERFKHDPIAFHNRERTDKACSSRSIGILCKSLEDRGESFRVRGVRSKESG